MFSMATVGIDIWSFNFKSTVIAELVVAHFESSDWVSTFETEATKAGSGAKYITMVY